MDDKDLGNLLDIDPLAEAEKITGKSYKDEDPDYPVPGFNETSALGFALNFEHARNKERVLQEMDDTCFRNTLEDYTRIITEEGFEKILEIPFIGDGWGEPVNDTFFVYWHPDGILLQFDTYNGNETINGSTFHYNWVTNSDGMRQNVTSSGGCVRHDQSGEHLSMWDIVEGKVAIPHPTPKFLNDSAPKYTDYDKYDEYSAKMKVWAAEAKQYFEGEHDAKIVYAGYHDGREALRFHIRQLREYGSFLPRWAECNMLHLTHYMDLKKKGDDWKERSALMDKINKDRIAMMPKHIQKAINYGKRNYVPLEPIEAEYYNKSNTLFRKHQGTVANVILAFAVIAFAVGAISSF